MQKSIRPILLCFFLLLLSACGREPRFVIGISQCSNDGWRQKVNREMTTAAYHYRDEAVLRFRQADNDGQRQVAQIDSFISEGVSLLVVAPSDIRTVAPAVSRAYKKGIPVVLYDRSTDSQEFTAYIGSDNVAIGRTMAQFIANELQGKGTVVEVTGLKGSSPVEERHRGFQEAIKAFPNINVITLEGDWTGANTEKIFGQLLDRGVKVDCVFGHNDAEAIGARWAAEKRHQEKEMLFVGIDALPGPHEGIEFVKKGWFRGSYVYPTKGNEVIALAMKILHHEPYSRINHLQSAMVTKDNVDIVMQQNEEIAVQQANIDYATREANVAYHALQNYRVAVTLTVVLIAVLLVLLVLIYRYYRLREQATRARLRELLADRGAPVAADGRDRAFIRQLTEVIKQQLSNPNLKVDDIGQRMGIGRVQLYRKVKALTGSTPNEMLRTARLEHARDLLANSTVTVQEAAFQSGFSSATYFSTCFRKEYGMPPVDFVNGKSADATPLDSQ